MVLDEALSFAEGAKRRNSAPLAACTGAEMRHQVAWDYPLSRSDAAHRLALHGEYMFRAARSQSEDAEVAGEAARELAAEHEVLCAKLAELQTRLSETCEDAVGSRRQVDWLRRVLEATVGLREAAVLSQKEREKDQQAEGKKQESSSDDAKKKAQDVRIMEPCTRSRKHIIVSDGSRQSLAKGVRVCQQAAEKHAAEAHRQTLLRRARRRQCRLRRAAEDAANNEEAPAEPKRQANGHVEAKFKSTLSFWSGCSATQIGVVLGASGTGGQAALQQTTPKHTPRISGRNRMNRASPAAHRWGCFIDGRFSAAPQEYRDDRWR